MKKTVVKVDKLPTTWKNLSLEAKYDLVNAKLHKLADIDSDWSIDIKLQSGGNGKNYSSYIEWTDHGCVWNEDDASYKPCQFVRKNPVHPGKAALTDLPLEIQDEFKNEDWDGEYDYDMPNIFNSNVSGSNWSECLEKTFFRLELLKLGFEICWECEEYREEHREFFEKHFEDDDDIFSSDDNDWGDNTGESENCEKELVIEIGSRYVSQHQPYAVKELYEIDKSLSQSVTKIVIGEGIEIIEHSAFAHCEKLTTIVLPESLSRISENAFAFCGQLVTIHIPENVKEIGRDAFYECSSLTTVNIPGGVTEIAEDTFLSCENLTGIHIPDSVCKIGEGAFYECFGLTHIDIPASVAEIGEDAFAECDNLSTATVFQKTKGVKKAFPEDCKITYKKR